MANIKKGLKRIETIFLVFWIVGIYVSVLFCVYFSPWFYIGPTHPYGVREIRIHLFLISICFLPYLGSKLLSWIGMGFVDDDKVKK